MSQATGTLHLVPVPIAGIPPGPGGRGASLQVLPQPTIETARAAQYFLVENARSARAFLKSIGHPLPIANLRIVEIGHHPDPRDAAEWLAPLRAAPGRRPVDAVLLSEAGCPGIADPGAGIVARAQELGIPVVPWVGPSSLLLALMAAGMNGQRFRFLGYLPQDRAALRAALLSIQGPARAGETQIFIETPYRNARLFDAILETCDSGLRLCLAIDVTEAGESIRTHTIAAWRALAQQDRPVMEKRPTVFLLGGEPSGG